MATTTTEHTATPVLSYVQVPETSENLDWADLVTLNLSKFDRPGGKQELATQFRKAMEDIGSFYVKNHGLSDADIDTQFALAKSILSLSNEEKQPYRAALEQGDYNGWKPAGTRNLIPGVKDNFEIYNIPKFIPEHANRLHPEIVKEYWDTIKQFSTHIHDQIVKKLLIIIAVSLGLDDEEVLINKHRYEKRSGDHLRYMKYYARSEEENRMLGSVWLKGHSDMGSLTLLFRQPVAALQVLTKDGTWKYVKPQMNALTVNIADGLEFLTNGFLKSSIHRVIAPPKDQAYIDRLGVLYMVRLEDDADLVPLKESPVLQELGLVNDQVLGSDGKPINAGEWVKQRIIKNLGNSTSQDGDNEVGDVEIVKGVATKYYD
ncbi:1-aminocyclopropane-1-carboxylate oxidase, putative [Talaromyces stipitatus ATCC 10500]|uniref:1-aminocyclopropane-1-carboxylate oxidase, putative n=1 Tax=Talaromyces stipitatus (strain ATCC 10500 / CBS 375.48 / QM 6759 / NRRL 1006) TaxID=441959 RepID=B8LYW1_TALSN|nr:1-aminocyclopropane-1-carboxylate oxidase, putative [Talaromyces stipitatus ATCC 10500]EED23469.1 1-aminocyclopropane-1-carboxylate oxidase, putative [Talaromyces stipitatus ATCC 10500]